MANLFLDKPRVRVGQIYHNTRAPNMQVEIFGKARDKWKTRVLTPKAGVYAGTHTLSNKTLASKFKLLI